MLLFAFSWCHILFPKCHSTCRLIISWWSILDLYILDVSELCSYLLQLVFRSGVPVEGLAVIIICSVLAALLFHYLETTLLLYLLNLIVSSWRNQLWQTTT